MKLLHCTHTHTKQAPAFKSEVKSSSMKHLLPHSSSIVIIGGVRSPFAENMRNPRKKKYIKNIFDKITNTQFVCK